MSEQDEVIKEDLTNPAPTEGEEVVEETTEEVVLEEATPAPGSKTDPALLLAALKEEREKRREAESKAKELEEKISSSAPETEVDRSPEGLDLLKRIESQAAEIAAMKGNSIKNDVLLSYPQLKDKWTEFEEFYQEPDNKGMNMRTAAKAFLVENGLFTARRKGLEKPTGGDKTPKPAGLTTEEVENIRKNDFRRYKKLIAEGKLDVKGD